MEYNDKRLTKEEARQADRNLTILIAIGVIASLMGVIQ